MELQEWEIFLYPLIFQKQTIVHQEGIKWMDQAHKLPFFSAEILFSLLGTFFSSPGVLLAVVFRVITENFVNPRFLVKSLVLMPKIIQMARLMEKEKIQHIHAHYATYPALAAWIIHRLTGISYSITVHAHDIFESKPMLAIKLKDASLIVAISKYNRDYLIQYLGTWIGEKIHVVHCGIRPESYPSSFDKTSIDGTLKIIHTGSLEPYKGQKYLIEASRILKQEGIPLQVNLIGMGIEKKNLENLIAQYGLQKEVTLLGSKTQEEVAAILPTGHCYVQPSVIMPEGTMEGIPVALMEAMACGLPVVSTRISGIPELIEDKVSGFLVPPEDSVSLAETLKWIYQNYSETLKCANNGKQTVIKDFDLHKNVLELCQLFDTII